MGQPEITWRPSDRAAGKSGSISGLFTDAWGSALTAQIQVGAAGWGPTMPLVTDTYSLTVTFDMNLKNTHLLILAGSPTLLIANAGIGQRFNILLQQGGSGSNTVTWFAGIRWPAGAIPSLTTVVGQIDAFCFICIAANSYLGFTAGLNL